MKARNENKERVSRLHVMEKRAASASHLVYHFTHVHLWEDFSVCVACVYSLAGL